MDPHLIDNLRRVVFALEDEDEKIQDLKDRVQDLEVSNQDLRIEISRLRALNAKQVYSIEAHEGVQGRVFTCFPQLPTELRNRIWQFATSPRMISVYRWKDFAVDCDVRIPMISRVCKESRALFLREYIFLGYSFVVGEHGEQGARTCPTYANPLIDTFYVSNLYMLLGDIEDYEPDLTFFARSMEEKALFANNAKNAKKWCVKSLALEHGVLECFSYVPEVLDVFDKFPALEEVVFLSRCEGSSDQGTIYNPSDEKSHECWEKGMRALGFLRTVKGCAKWAGLRTTVAMISKNDYGVEVTDLRQGLSMVGPGNRSDRWVDPAGGTEG